MSRELGEAPVSRASAPVREDVLPRQVYKATATADPSLKPGTGGTDKYGNVTHSTQGMPEDVALAQAHESVHSFLSPKAMNGLREFRANARMGAYQNSGLCKYLEEALAEGYAQAKVKGSVRAAVVEGLKFPIQNGYVSLSRVVGEAAIGTLMYGGILFGVYATVKQ